VTTPATSPSGKPPSKHSPLLPAIVAGGFGIAIALIQLYCPTRSDGPCAKVGRIAFFSPQGGEDPRFDGIRKVLRAEDCPLGEVREETNRRRNEIRYFHPRDRAAAEAISALLVRKNTVDAVPRFLPSEADERPAGQLELWLDRGK
jgi:hypothetical protein